MGLQEKIRNLREIESKFIAQSSETLLLRTRRIEEIKKDIHLKLIEELSDIIFRKNISNDELKKRVVSSAQKLVYDSDFPLTNE